MPILKQEPDLYPPDLFDSPTEENGQRQWWALYTMSRREKDLMRRLHKKQIAFYSPTYESQHRSPNGRLRTSYHPLFSNYVFLCGTDEDRYQAVCTGCVSRNLEVTDGDALFADLKQIRQLIEVGADLTPELELPIGQRVRVLSGALEGQVGTIIERRGKQRLLVAVNFLQQGASVEMDPTEVEPFEL